MELPDKAALGVTGPGLSPLSLCWKRGQGLCLWPAPVSLGDTGTVGSPSHRWEMGGSNQARGCCHSPSCTSFPGGHRRPPSPRLCLTSIWMMLQPLSGCHLRPYFRGFPPPWNPSPECPGLASVPGVAYRGSGVSAEPTCVCRRPGGIVRTYIKDLNQVQE